MGLFGFGRKHRQHAKDGEDAVATESHDQQAGAADPDTKADVIDEPSFPETPSADYEHRGDQYGPWDVGDDEAPADDEYLDLGAYMLPFMQNIELRVKANRATQQVMGCTISYGSSSLEIEAFAAPKTMGLWDDVRADLLSSNPAASEHPGTFGMEVRLPVSVKGANVITRIAAVDGPRWMLRAIFSGPAAQSRGEEATALDHFFSDIIVVRGDEPLAPRDLLPMHAPVSPAERRAGSTGDDASDDADAPSMPQQPKGPFDSDQQTEVKTTLARGPMFSEVR